jgi:hypothetical protein
MFALFCLTFLCLAFSFENTEVTRVISNLPNGLVVVDVSIQCYSSSAGETRYVYSLEPNKTVALLLARNLKGAPLPIRQRDSGFVIDVSSARLDGRSFGFRVTEHLVDALLPLPSFVNLQSEEPDTLVDGKWVRPDVVEDSLMTGMVLTQSCLLYSPYVTVSESMEVRLEGLVLSVESAPGKHHPWKLKGNVVSFGPFRSVPPHSFEPVRVASINPTPVLIANSLNRVCELGWKVRCTDFWSVVNESPKLEPMCRNCTLCPGRVAHLHVTLPSEAFAVEFGDRLGKFPHTNVVDLAKGREWEFVPRYAVLGGSRAEFEVHYSLPASEQVDLFAPIREVGVIRKLTCNRMEMTNVVNAHLQVAEKVNVTRLNLFNKLKNSLSW